MDVKPSIRRNIVSLLFLQGANYIFPLITLPWFTRTLGPDGFGRIGFATAFCMYFSLLSDYGFNLSATRQIAIHRDNQAECSRIFWSTFTTKFILSFVGFLLLLFLCIIMPRLAQERTLLVTGYLSVVGTVLTPVWYFQGIERLTVLTKVNLTARIVTLPVIFILVRSKDDVLLAMLITSTTGLIAGCLSILAMIRLHKILWAPPSFFDIWRALHDGWHLFVSSAAVSLYTTSNTVILGFIAGNAEVGYFTAAQRLIKAAQSMVTPLSQAVYPRISHLMQSSRDDAFVLIRKVLRMQGIITLVLSLVLLIGASVAVEIAFGQSYVASVPVLRWLAPLPFFIGLSNVFGVQAMLPLGFHSAFSRILLASGLINLLIFVPLGYRFGAAGAGASVCITELLVTIAMALYLNRRAVPIFVSAKASI